MALRTPKYRLHKGSGQALVQINGQRIYLGTYGSERSKERYRRLVAKHLQCNDASPPLCASAADLTINELIVAYWRFAEGYYVRGSCKSCVNCSGASSGISTQPWLPSSPVAARWRTEAPTSSDASAARVASSPRASGTRRSWSS